MQAIEVDGRAVWIWDVGELAEGEAPFVVILPGSGDTPDEMTKTLPLVQQAIQAGRCRSFRLVGFASEDWNREYSPWPGALRFSKEAPFSGWGGETLAWIQEELVPALEQDMGRKLAKENMAIMGYSLAGLFALWSFIESGAFGAVASCSGSLWYTGWQEYMGDRKPPARSRVYLSLGDREERARNPHMAMVGDMTRATARYLKAQPEVDEVELVWQEGGHFTNVPERMAAALVWLARA